MKRLVIGAALAAAAMFAALSPPASAQTVRDASTFEIVSEPQPGALQNPSADPAEVFETATPTQFTPDGEGEFAWGRHLLTFLNAFADNIVIPALLGFAALVFAKVTGRTMEADDAARLRDYMKSAYQFGLNALGLVIGDKKLTVKEASPLVEWMLHYADMLFPKLVEKFGGREANRLRAWSIIDLAEGETIPLAPTAAAPIPAPVTLGTPAAPATA